MDRLPWYTRASKADRDDVMGATQELNKDVEALTFVTANPVPRPTVRGMHNPREQYLRARASRLSKEAKEIYQKVKSAAPVALSSAALFSDYCHDSFAGFRPYDQFKILGMDVLPGSWEPEGYLRWRRRYEGNDIQLVQHVPASEDTHYAGAFG